VGRRRALGAVAAAAVLVALCLGVLRSTNRSTPASVPGGTGQSAQRSGDPPPTSVAPSPTAVPVRLGMAVDADRLGDPRLARLFADHGITSLTPENAMKAGRIHPGPRTYAWTDADRVVGFAEEHDLRVRGHTLVWHRDLPMWVSKLRDRAAGRAALRAHIEAVMGRYRGRVAQWDVVNEALDSSGELRDSPWRRAVGDDYVALAFRYAAEADPQARLFYNDFGAESAEDGSGGNSAKVNGVIRLVEGLRSQGVRVDGVGLELHADGRYPGSGTGFEATMRRLGGLGVATEITELDVSGRGGATVQARRYAEVGAACARVPTCTGVTTWGVDDAHTWRPGTDPLLFDERLRPKPALEALRGAVRR
jgi:endo-1,4-beta-xylanase